MESCLRSAHDANEVVLTCMDGLLCQFAMVIIWRHKLECHVGCPDSFLYAAKISLSRTCCFGEIPWCLILSIALRCANIISLSVLFFIVSIQVEFHHFCVGSSDINYPYSICGGTSLSGSCRKFPWVHRLPRKHHAAFPLDAVLPHCDVALTVGRSRLWCIALPAVGFSCDPSGFLLILGSAYGHLSL